MKHFLDATYGSPARGTFQLLGQGTQSTPPGTGPLNNRRVLASVPSAVSPPRASRRVGGDVKLAADLRPAGNSSRTLEQNARGRREATLRERHSGSSYQQLMAYNRDKLTEHHMPGGRSLHSLGGAAGYRTKGGAVLSPSLMEGGGVLEAQRLEREAAVANDAYWNSALLLTPALVRCSTSPPRIRLPLQSFVLR